MLLLHAIIPCFAAKMVPCLSTYIHVLLQVYVYLFLTKYIHRYKHPLCYNNSTTNFRATCFFLFYSCVKKLTERSCLTSIVRRVNQRKLVAFFCLGALLKECVGFLWLYVLGVLCCTGNLFNVYLQDPSESNKCIGAAIQEFREGQHMFELKVIVM